MSGGGTNTNTVQSAPPQQVLDAYSQAFGTASNAATAPLQQYPGNTVAGFTPDQTTAMQTIDNAQGIAQPYINQAGTYAASAATPITPTAFSPSAVSAYESPYTSQVVGATEAQMQNMDEQQQQSLAGNAISKGAWGGDRAGIAQAELANQQDLANNQTIAGLENSGYTQALGEFNQEQTTGVNAQTASDWLNANAASTYGALGNEAENSALTGASAQMQSGTAQQTLAQEQLNVPYENFLQQQAYPFQTSQFLTQAAEGTANQGGGSTSTSPGADTTGQTISTLASLGAIAAMLYAKGGAVEPRRGFDAGGNVFGAGFKLPAVPGATVNIVPGAMSIPGGTGTNGGIPAPPHAPVASSGAGGSSTSSLVGLGSAIKTSQAKQTADAAAQESRYNAGINDGFGANSVPDQALYGKPPVPGAMTTDNTDFSDPSMFGDEYGGADIGAAGADAGLATDAGVAADAGIADDAMLAMAARGGVIRRGFDDGGDVGEAGLIAAGIPDAMGGSPIANSQLSRYEQMSPEQLQEMAQRVPASSPQSTIVNRALMASRMKPQSPAAMAVAKGAPSVVGAAPVAPTAVMAAGVQPQQVSTQQGQPTGYGPYRRGGPVGFADGGMPGFPSYINPTRDPGQGVSVPGGVASALRRGGIAHGFDDGGDVGGADLDLDDIGDLYAGAFSPPPVRKGEQPAMDTGAWLRGAGSDVGTTIGNAASALLNKDNSSVHYGLGKPAPATDPDMVAPTTQFSPNGPPVDLSGIGDVYADPRGAVPAGIDLSGIGDLYGGSAAVPDRGGLGAPPPDDVVMPAGHKPAVPSRALAAMPAGISAAPSGLSPPPGLDDDDDLDGAVPRQALEGKPALADDAVPQPDLSGRPASALNPAGGKGATAATATPAEPSDKPAKAWNDPSFWMPLLAAGLGGMSSHNTTTLGVLGEGGLRGLEYYTAQQKADLEAKKAASDDTYRQGELANSAQKNQTDAKRLDAEADRQMKQLSETSRHNQAEEGLTAQQREQTATYQQGMLDRSKFSFVAGTGPDPTDPTKTVPGTYANDVYSGESTFHPGVVLTGKPGAGQGATNAIIEKLMQPGPNGEPPAAKTAAEALSILHDPSGARAGQLQNARERLAEDAAKNDTGYVSDPQGTITKMRNFYGLGAAPGAQPTAAAQQRPAVAAPAQRPAAAPSFPAIPQGVPSGAQYSPSKNSWWWQENGKWQSAPGG